MFAVNVLLYKSRLSPHNSTICDGRCDPSATLHSRPSACLTWSSQGGMGACPPVVAGNFSKYFSKYTIFAVLNFMYFVQSNIQLVSPASGDPRPPLGLCPGPRWGLPSPDALLANSWLHSCLPTALCLQQPEKMEFHFTV